MAPLRPCSAQAPACRPDRFCRPPAPDRPGSPPLVTQMSEVTRTAPRKGRGELRDKPRRIRASHQPAVPRHHLRRASSRSTAPVTLAREGNRGVPRRGGLLDGQRPVGRAEAQRVRQGLLALADLLAGVDVEQPDGLQQFARPLAQRGLDLGGRDVRVDDQRDILRRDREGGDARAPAAARRRPPPARSRSSSIAQVRAGRPSALTTRGCSSPAWPMTCSAPSTTTASSAQRPGCHGPYWPWRTSEFGPGLARRACARPRPRRPSRPGGPCPTSRPARGRPRARRRRAAAGRAARRSSDGDLLVGGAAVDGQPHRRHRGSSRGVEDQAGLEERQVVAAPAVVAAQRAEQARQQRGAQRGLLVGERVDELDDPALRVVGRPGRAGRRRARR